MTTQAKLNQILDKIDKQENLLSDYQNIHESLTKYIENINEPFQNRGKQFTGQRNNLLKRTFGFENILVKNMP